MVAFKSGERVSQELTKTLCCCRNHCFLTARNRQTATASMDDQISNIRSSVIDGRAQTPRFRQRQLAALHSTLTKSKNDFLNAIVNDTQYTRTEAEAQYYLTLQSLKSIYLQLDPLKMIETEYSIAKGHSNLDRRVAYGCAYIVPSQTSALYSTIVPATAAIAAGNCVVLELARNLSEVNRLLRKVLPGALDRLVFVVVDKDPFDKVFKNEHCVILDGRAKEDAVSTSRAISTPLTRVAAVVDRSANVQEAASEIVRARFSFGGESAYAPDVILVNEFSVKQFCSAVAQAALSYLTSNVDAQSNGSVSHSNSARKTQSGVQSQLEEAGATLLASGSRGTVALLPAKLRSSEVLRRKINEPVLLIHPISSLDDAIDFLNSSSTEPLLAAHIFAAPESAKYLSHFTNASASFVNGIPTELLVGPQAPDGFILSVSPRYTSEMFSIPHPEAFKHTSTLTPDLTILLDGTTSSQGKKNKLKKLHDISLPQIKEGTGPPVGFFEQGLFVGLGVTLSTLIVSTTITAVYLYPAVMRRMR